MKTIIIATPHSRNDDIQQAVTRSLEGYRIIRFVEKNELTLENLSLLNPQWVFFPHWSWMIPQEIYENFQCVIFHMTDLPYGRGGSPLQNLIIRGHSDTKLSALKCVHDVDAGPVYAQESLNLEGTAEEILCRTSKLIEKLIILIVKNNPKPVCQNGEIVKFKRRIFEDGNLFEVENLEKVYDYIRMLDAEGYPPAFLSSQKMHFEFRDAELKDKWVEAKVRIRLIKND